MLWYFRFVKNSSQLLNDVVVYHALVTVFYDHLGAMQRKNMKRNPNGDQDAIKRSVGCTPYRAGDTLTCRQTSEGTAF